MIYVCSDLNGYPLEDFERLLKKADFTDSDTLYILGDAAGMKGDGGIGMLLWIMKQKNVKLIKGNNERTLSEGLSRLTGFSEPCTGFFRVIDDFFRLGWGSAIESLLNTKIQDFNVSREIMNFTAGLPLYAEISVSGRNFILVHSGIGNFVPRRKIRDYDADDLLCNQPKITDAYYSTKTVIFGHTPTGSLDARYEGRILKTETWIDVDTYAGPGTGPALLRLDDMEEIYAE